MKENIKIDIVLFIIAAVITGLLTFGIFLINGQSPIRILVTVGAGLTFFVTLGGLMAVTSSRTGMANIKVVSSIFFVLFFLSHLLFSLIRVSFNPYIIITGILLSLYVLLYYLIIRVIK